MVGDSEWTYTYIIGDSEKDGDWGQWTCGCDEWDWRRECRDQVVTLLVPSHSVWESEDVGGDTGFVQKVLESEDVGDAGSVQSVLESEDVGDEIDF